MIAHINSSTNHRNSGKLNHRQISICPLSLNTPVWPDTIRIARTNRQNPSTQAIHCRITSLCILIDSFETLLLECEVWRENWLRFIRSLYAATVNPTKITKHGKNANITWETKIIALAELKLATMRSDINKYTTLMIHTPMRKPGFWNLGEPRDNFVVSKTISSTDTLKVEVIHDVPTSCKIKHNTSNVLEGSSVDTSGSNNKTVDLVEEKIKTKDLRKKTRIFFLLW